LVASEAGLGIQYRTITEMIARRSVMIVFPSVYATYDFSFSSIHCRVALHQRQHFGCSLLFGDALAVLGLMTGWELLGWEC
jgi:hypothetical protein